VKRAKKKIAEAPQPVADPETGSSLRGVVGIGASAGGLKALQELFGDMPANSGLAFVVVQHLSPEHESHMAEILGRHASMKVTEAADGMRLEPDAVYTAPPGAFLTLRQGRLCTSAPAAGEGVRMPIDFFLASLAQEQAARAVCVILSGTGSDGAHGVRAVRGAGGMAMVQEPGTAEFDAMPRSAIATGLVDYVLPVKAMPQTLLAYAGRRAGGLGDEVLSREDEAVLDRILELLHKQTGNDYRRYKKGTVGRRLARRMGLRQVGSLSDYLQFLAGHPDEVAQLSKDMLISVTSFFRDPEAFEVLRETVIKPIVAAATPGGSIRAWVPGCATGEEAYSLAILLKEELAERELAGCTVQVFASDIDEGALGVGRAGIYPASVAADVSPERLARFFTSKDGGWQVTKELRDVVIFSLHNLLADPPFARLDLVSCRNLLIYIEPDLQGKILALFAFTLNPSAGCLFLGKAETIGKAGDWFDLVDEKWRVFRRNSARVPACEFPVGSGRLRGLAAGRTALVHARPVNYGDVVRRVVIDAVSAGVVLVDAGGRVLYLDGPVGRFLDLPTGEPALNIFAMVSERLAPKLRAAVRKAVETGEASVVQGVHFKRQDGIVTANLAVRPAGERGAGHEVMAAILFEETCAPGAKADGQAGRNAPEAGDAPLVAQLEAEVGTLRNELRATNEDHQASAEEFKSANEEVMAMNEELQSANEELESSREEIQSVNEELGTVNTQLSDRLRDLAAANNDLTNLINATAIATVFLTRELRIKSFTPAAARLFRFIPADGGRPIGDLSPRFEGVDLAALAGEVLQNLSPVEREVHSAVDGTWHMLRVLPYRTTDDRIEGVVLTFTEITRLKLSEQDARVARAYAEGIVETMRDPLMVLDSAFRVVSANRAFYDFFKTVPANTVAREVFALGDGQWDIPKLRTLLEKVLPERISLDGFLVEHDFPKIGYRAMLINARLLMRTQGEAELILLSLADVTESRHAADELRESELRLHLAQDAAKAGTWEWDLRTNKHFWSEELWKLYGLEPHRCEPSQHVLLQTVHPDDRAKTAQAMKEAVRAGGELVAEWRVRDGDGEERWLMSRGQPLRSADNQVVRYVGIVVDITERKWMEMDLEKSREELEKKVAERTDELQVRNEQLLHSQKLEALGRLAGGVAHDFNNLMAVVTGYGRRVLRDSGLDAAHRSSVEQMTRAGEGAANLTRQLLAFSRKQVISPVVLDLNEVVDKMRAMLPTVLGEDIAVDFNLQPDPWPVLADPAQITQVIMNLAVNARDAMPKGGHLKLRTANVESPASGAVIHEDLPPGRYALLSVSDNGTGMSEEVQGHLFEPFFTTKEQGEGTGLGLSSVYGIVQQSGGHIRVDTAPGRGSAFSLYFPASGERSGATGDDETAAALCAPDGPAAPVLRGSETILLVEDESSVCQLVTTELQELGYRVLPCKTAGEAICVSETHEGPVDLLLSDVTLPGISGPTRWPRCSGSAARSKPNARCSCPATPRSTSCGTGCWSKAWPSSASRSRPRRWRRRSVSSSTTVRIRSIRPDRRAQAGPVSDG
jgi:two-component system CheB/CheR fusion protein